MKSQKFGEEFINKLLKEKEGKTLDFKEKITSKEKIAKTLSAMANTEGGIIVIGMSDSGKVKGIDSEEERYMIEAANEEHCTPKVSLSFQDFSAPNEKYPAEGVDEDLHLLIVFIQKSLDSIVYAVSKKGEKKAYRRENDQTLSV
jgi:predicted HTH transcriptional regulator